jgi:hypothetical protein
MADKKYLKPKPNRAADSRRQLADQIKADQIKQVIEHPTQASGSPHTPKVGKPTPGNSPRHKSDPLVDKAPERPRNPLCNDPSELAWLALADSFHELRTEFEGLTDEALVSECGAALSVIRRVLRCQESNGTALAAVRAVSANLSTVLRSTTRDVAFAKNLAALNARVEDLHRLAPCEDCKKPISECSCGGNSTECSCPDEPETGFTHYAYLLEVEHVGRLVHEAVLRLDATLREVRPHVPNCAPFNACHAAMKEVTSNITGVVAGVRAAAASCDPQMVEEALRALHNYAASATSAYDRMHFELGQISHTTQLAFFSALESETDRIGLLTATLLNSVHKLSTPSFDIGSQLRKVWTGMRRFVAGPVKQAFQTYEERQFCPQEQCYEKATAELRRIIEDGLADSDGLAMDVYGGDARLLRHRQRVDACVQEILRLDCKAWEGFDPCAWTRLGSFTMRLYAILGRSSSIVAGQVRTLAQSWKNLTQWWNHMSEEPPTDVVPFLRAGLAILRSFEDRAQGHGIYAQLPTGPSTDYGRMHLRIVDDSDRPMAGCRVLIVHDQGHTREAIADGDGRVRELMPKGPCTVSSPGEEFPAFKMTCY